MNIKPVIYILVALEGLYYSGAYAQNSVDSIRKPYRNVIRYNISGPTVMGFGKYVVLGYERIFNNNQSFSVNAGPVALPKGEERIPTEIFVIRKDLKSSGVNFSADYRVYLGRENKYGIPHGISIGPYFSYNQFNKQTQWDYVDSMGQDKTVTTDMSMRIISFGGQIGYQFIVHNRLIVDFVFFGPGIGNYFVYVPRSNFILDGDMQKLRERVKRNITEAYTGLDHILDKEDFDRDGKIDKWSVGYRYVIHIGYLF